MKHRQHTLAKHREPQRIMVAHLARDDQIGVRVLEHAVPGAGAHPDDVDGRVHGRPLGPRDHDVLHAQLGGVEAHDPRELRFEVELDAAAVTGALETGGDRALDGLHDGYRVREVILFYRLVQDFGEPVVDAALGGVDGRVRAVHGDVVLGQAQDDALVRVREGEGFEAAEDEGVWDGCQQGVW